MTVHRYGTLINPAHFVEIPDPDYVDPSGSTTAMKRPAAGTHLLVKDAVTGTPLDDIVTTDYGYWSYTVDDVPEILVSGDGGTSWVGPLISVDAHLAAIADAQNGSLALAAVQEVQQAMADLQATVGVPGGIATLDPSGHLDAVQGEVFAAFMQNADGTWNERPATALPVVWQFRVSGSTPPTLDGSTAGGGGMVDGLDILRDPFGVFGA